MTSPPIISPAQPGTQATLAGTLRLPGGGEVVKQLILQREKENI